MKQARKQLVDPEEEKDADISMTNGLTFRQIPQINKLQFDPNTEDTYIYRRKTGLNLEDQFLNCYKSELKFKQVLTLKRRELDPEQVIDKVAAPDGSLAEEHKSED